MTGNGSFLIVNGIREQSYFIHYWVFSVHRWDWSAVLRANI